MDKKLTDWRNRTAACAAAENVLPGESPADYQELWETWLSEYEPESEADLLLLAAVVNAAWRMRRAEKLLTDIERALRVDSTDAAQWSRPDISNLSCFLRFRAMAESSFHNNLRLVEFMKSKTDKREQTAAQARAIWEKNNPTQAAAAKQTDVELAISAVLKPGASKPAGKKDSNIPEASLSRAQQLFSGQNNIKKQKKIVRLDQWVEVRITDGQTVTQLYPSNAKLIERGKSMLPPPELVYRRLNFPDGVPPEYDWVGISDEDHRERGGMGIQRMTIDSWLELIDAEAKRSDGHLNPIGNLPRPEEHGGCDCPVCTTNREILERAIEPNRAA